MTLDPGDKRLRTGTDNPLYKTEGVSARTISKRARLIPLGPCVDCGGKANDRVFPDGREIDSENPVFVSLCRRCHMIRDGRLDRLKTVASTNSKKSKMPPGKCCNCGLFYKPLRGGRCDTCYNHYRKHGIEKPVSGKPIDSRLICECGKSKDARSKRCWACDKKSVVDEAGEKICRGCNKILSLDNFAIRAGNRPRSRCRSCEKISSNDFGRKLRRERPEHVKLRKKQWEQANPKKYNRMVRRTVLKKMGFTSEKIEEILAKLELATRCDICLRTIEEIGTLRVDHCHSTGKFRGFLCNSCNLGLGKFQDDLETLKRAVFYLEDEP
jgi:hypothetical protein